MTRPNAKQYRLKRGWDTPSHLHEFGGTVLSVLGVIPNVDDLLTLSELTTMYPISVALREWVRGKPIYPDILVCPVCETEFVPIRDGQKYCCGTHKVSAQNKRSYQGNIDIRRKLAREYQRRVRSKS